MAYEILCPSCGRLIEAEARFCPYCGTSIQPRYPPPAYYYQPYVPDIQVYYAVYQSLQPYLNQIPPWVPYMIGADLYRRAVNATYNRLKNRPRS